MPNPLACVSKLHTTLHPTATATEKRIPFIVKLLKMISSYPALQLAN